jgi:cardiolipin synthase A/B
MILIANNSFNARGEELKLLQGSSEFFPALVTALDAAQHEVRLETYIFDLTAGGTQVALALERAAQRGVATYVLVDGAGSASLPADWLARFSAAGVQWCVFSPLGSLGFLRPTGWRRLHRKLCCVDQCIAFCGGINILDDFYDPNHGALTQPRFDFSVRVTGPLVGAVHAAMLQLWTRRERGLRLPRLTARMAVVPSAQAALVLRDNLRQRTGIEKAYRRAIAQAQHEIIIANAYFVPGRKLRLALIHAARRGVTVRLLLQGKYEYFMQYYAARPVYSALLKAGVEIHEYSASFLHAKVAVVDGTWATVGSSNLDPLSLLLAREANITAHDATLAGTLRARLVQAIAQDGLRMDPLAYAQRPLRQRCLEYVAWGLMRIALLFQGRKYL